MLFLYDLPDWLMAVTIVGAIVVLSLLHLPAPVPSVVYRRREKRVEAREMMPMGRQS
jgi:hypothetical protein